MQHQPLDFEANERAQNERNLAEIADEVAKRSPRLAQRITHFSGQFGIPVAEFWDALDADPTGPLASTLAKEARRQNIHERAVGEYIAAMPLVSGFRKLPATGNNAIYITSDGQFVTGEDLGEASKPSKSMDFRWQTGNITCYAAQKYIKEGGGHQLGSFIEMETLLTNFMPRRNNDTALFALVDGPFFTETRLNQLRGLVRMQSPFSYAVSVNELMPILERLD